MQCFYFLLFISILLFLTKQITFMRSCGLMDKASDFGSEDCMFESCHDRGNFFFPLDPVKNIDTIIWMEFMIPSKMNARNVRILRSLLLQKISAERFILYPIVYYLLSESLGHWPVFACICPYLPVVAWICLYLPVLACSSSQSPLI